MSAANANTHPGVAPEQRHAPVTAAQAWLARLAILAALASVVVLVVGGAAVLGVALAVVIGLALTFAGGWWFLSKRGLARLLAAAVVVAVPIGVIVLCIAQGVLGTMVAAIALAVVATAAGRAAIVRARPTAHMPERRTAPPHRPFVIMNPRSGGGKVVSFDLQAKAVALGAEVALIEGPGTVDVAALARSAVADGADLLGVAGGDGTQALVAGIAAEHGLPFMVISAGTRNHLAMDLGLDRERPDTGLDALTDGVEMYLDLGNIGGRTFVNNASFGAYAEIVQRPEYREDKRGTTLQLMPELLSGQAGPRLVVRIDDHETIEAPKALLVSNNPYETSDLSGLGRRARMDTGVLGVIAITVESTAQAVDLIRGNRASGIRHFLAHEVVVDADTEEIPVGIDGEAVMMPTPVRCTIVPQALRVRVPRERPGVPVLAGHLRRRRLIDQALTVPLISRMIERFRRQRSGP